MTESREAGGGAERPATPAPVAAAPSRFGRVWRELAPVRHQLLEDTFVCGIGTLMLAALLLSGGVLFSTLEGGLEQQVKCGVRHEQLRFLDDLWAKSDQLERREWRALARRHLHGYEEALLTAYNSGVTSSSGQRLWTISNGIVYAWTVISTLGYGHLSPATSAGKAVSIVYAVLGIPIFLIVLADYGKLFTRGLKYLMATCYRLYHTKSCTRVRRTAPVESVTKGIQAVYDKTGLGGGDAEGVDPDEVVDDGSPPVVTVDDEFNLPVSLALSILVAYLFVGALMFVITEDWTYFDAFYFVFISMTTIGFGDLVPSSAGVMMCTTLYMIFGLALTSMCINVIQEKLMHHFKMASIKLGTRFGVNVPATPAPALVEVAPVHGKAQ